MARGDHIYVHRGPYTHHGIDLGDSIVIDFAGADGTKSKSSAVIRQTTLENFADGGTVQIRAYRVRFERDRIVARAQSKLGGSGYDLFGNNCEHFATWCVTGEHSSAQVETVATGVRVVGVAVVPQVGVDIVVGVGGATALSAPNLMSGLATIGGGSVLTGIGLLGGASGLLAAGATCVALRDKPMLPDEERQARRVGRYGTIGGAALGVGVSLRAVGAMGVAGYNAAGLSSGLAALGAGLGGGMAQGVMTTLAIPALLAAILGYLLYRVTQWWLQPPSASQALLVSDA
jgi:hypothetical protein